jgi:FdhD protein
MAGRGVAERRILKVGAGGEARRARDRLAVEEPLELRVAGRPVGVTMRTPGDDFELAIGYCISERLVARPDDVAAVRFCAPEGQAQEFNVLTVDLRPGVPVPDPSLDRLAVTSSSCGVCGKASIDAVTVDCPTLAGDGLAVAAGVLTAIPGRVREAQRVFEQTGGLHAAAICGPDGQVRCVREDVGRHNAVDKVIGWAATERRLPLHGMVLFVSGRCSFEVVQKAAVAGVPVIAAVSAPSSLAVELADRIGMTLVGFLRGDTMNVYTHPDRITLPTPSATASDPAATPTLAPGPASAAGPASAPGTAATPASVPTSG